MRKATTMLATWDDHDYGINDGGNTYKMRKESQKVFVDFFQDHRRCITQTVIWRLTLHFQIGLITLFGSLKPPVSLPVVSQQVGR